MTGVLPLAAAAVSAVLALPNWMAGSWVSENAQEWGEECWTPEHGRTIPRCFAPKSRVGR
ncbi:hypothetical protein A8V01_04345 [Novosphingobium guangzhouense]|uniref:DUF6265 domain-containing protein n=2 Tax=Novosphingobium guangzhouense TaxID=1850347 RepID=A0A2K2G255_9SPHN|nr:hypothetical protein A8V01_04345 [Novosphingobium guangzhouense]